jgi:hypothetical protein
MKIARVFPTRTSFSPDDADAYFAAPELFTRRDYDEVHVSVAFSWDMARGHQLKKDWESVCANVKIGGCAFGSHAGEFEVGMYLKKGNVITSRGCPNRCGFCLVPQREGALRELQIKEGHIIQDNNFLACSRDHQRKVFEMLRRQHGIEFKGGLESRRITSKVADEFRSLRINALWLACDRDADLKPLHKAVRILQKAGFRRYQLRCYVLIGKDMQQEQERLKAIFRMGVLPSAQIYQPFDAVEKISYSKEWSKFLKHWSRPAIYKAAMKEEKMRKVEMTEEQKADCRTEYKFGLIVLALVVATLSVVFLISTYYPKGH